MNYTEFVNALSKIVLKNGEKNGNIRNVYESLSISINTDIFSDFDEMKIGKISFDVEFGHTSFFLKTGQNDILVASISFLASGWSPNVDVNLKPSCSIKFYVEKADEIIFKLFQKKPNILEQINNIFENATSSIPNMINIDISDHKKICHVDEDLYFESNNFEEQDKIGFQKEYKRIDNDFFKKTCQEYKKNKDM